MTLILWNERSLLSGISTFDQDLPNPLYVSFLVFEAYERKCQPPTCSLGAVLFRRVCYEIQRADRLP